MDQLGFQEEVCRTLGNIGPQAAPAGDKLVAFLQNPFCIMMNKKSVADALGKIGLESSLLELAASDFAGSQFHAVHGLAAIRPATAESKAAIIKVSQSKSFHRHVIMAPGNVRPADKEIVAPLKDALQRVKDPSDRGIIVSSLGKLRPILPSAIQALRKAASDPDNRVRAEATYQLKEIERAAEDDKD